MKSFVFVLHVVSVLFFSSLNGWTFQGPGDPIEVIGITGPKGDSGQKGDTGAIGNTGPMGSKGDTGAVGLKGDTGEKGSKGDIGERGPKGDPGPMGPSGQGSGYIVEKIGSASSQAQLKFDFSVDLFTAGSSAIYQIDVIAPDQSRSSTRMQATKEGIWKSSITFPVDGSGQVALGAYTIVFRTPDFKHSCSNSDVHSKFAYIISATGFAFDTINHEIPATDTFPHTTTVVGIVKSLQTPLDPLYP